MIPTSPAPVRLRPRYTISQGQVRLSARRPVRVEELEVARAVAPHDHAYHEVCVVLAGSGVHRTPAGDAPLRAGAVAVLPPGAAGVHAIERVDGLRVANVYYLAEWLLTDLGLLWRHAGLVPLFLDGTLFDRQTTHPAPQFTLGDDDLAATVRELRDLEAESRHASPSPLVLRACLVKAMVRMARAYAREDDPLALTPPGDFRSEVWAALQQIERLVAAAEPLDVARLAGAVGLSPDHLSRLFRRATGRGVVDYYQHRRVHRACQLLLDGRRSVTDVAADLGYADTPHLCRMFKRHRGLTPRAYRRTYLTA